MTPNRPTPASTGGLRIGFPSADSTDELAVLVASDDHVIFRFGGGSEAYPIEPLPDFQTAVRSLLASLPVDAVPVVYTTTRAAASTLADAALLLLISERWSFVQLPDGASHHVVFAYAVPVSLSQKVSNEAFNHLRLLVACRALVLLPACEFILVRASSIDLGLLYRQNRRLLRKNLGVTVRCLQGAAPSLGDWEWFCHRRFNAKVPTSEISLLDVVFTGCGAWTREFWAEDTCIARSLVFREIVHQVDFDVLAPWDERFGHLSPGIYAALHNLAEAGRSGFSYSLCYGDYQYKSALLRGLLKASLLDLVRDRESRDRAMQLHLGSPPNFFGDSYFDDPVGSGLA